MVHANAGVTPTNTDELLRKQLVASFHDENVHGGFEKIFSGVPPQMRGVRPPNQPFTLWRLLEHIRLCILDFLDYCRVPNYVEPPFPSGFWPAGDVPADDAAWDESMNGVRTTMAELEAIILDPSTDLFAPIPDSDGRTVLRQAIACLDHTAYHLGEALLLRRLLGIWRD